MSDERLRDIEARRAAQTVFDRPVVLEAGAGTGKTAALVARIIAWAVGPGWNRALANLGGGPEIRNDKVAEAVLDGIVAITFTEDAAAEMTRRVALALSDIKGYTDPGNGREWTENEQIIVGLERQSLPEDMGQVRERAGLLLTNLERLRTSTIHAFSRALVSRFPVEAGVHPAFEVDADGSATAECLENAVEELLTVAYGNGFLGTEGLLLAEHGIGPIEIRNAVLALAEDGVSAEALVDDPLSPRRLAPVVDRLFVSLDGIAPLAERLSTIKGASRTVKTACWLLDFSERDRVLSVDDPGTFLVKTSNWIRGRENWKEDFKKLKTWKFEDTLGNKEKADFLNAGAGIFDKVRALAETLDFIMAFDPEVFGALRRLFGETLGRVQSEKRRRGIVGFQDLLVGARRLLEDHPQVRSGIRAELEQLLVDEMQDTDIEQARIVELLGLESEGEGGPGLFLVGDPKQSIYGWRKADMAVYRGLVRKVEAQGGEVRALTVNFRSVQPVLDEVSRLVEPVMNEEAGVQPPFVGLLVGAVEHGVAVDGESLRAPVEHWVSLAADPEGGPGKTSAREVAEMEAEAVARDVAALWREGTNLNEMAVLLRSRGHQAAYLEALRRYGVPYVVGKDPNYYRTREISELTALVRLVLDPFDHVALVAVLRSPIVGVPDAALRPLWRAGLPALWSSTGIEERAEDFQKTVDAAAREVEGLDLDGVSLKALGGWPEALKHFLVVISVLRESFAEEAPDEFLEKLRQSVLVEPLAASRFPGAYRLANVDRFLVELEEALLEGETGEAVLRRLRRAEREKPDETSGRPRTDAEGVRVLTIHGAKGLGFEHVYLVQTHASGGRGRRAAPTAAHWERDKNQWEMTLLGRRSPGYFEHERLRKKVEEAEKVRLLYVALTRAKKRLVTVGGKSTKGSLKELLKGRATGWPNSSHLWEDGSLGPREDRHEARWVWLGHPSWDAETPKIFGSSPRERRIDAAKVVSDADQLERLIEAGLERQGRPWLETASEEAHRRLREALAERFEGAEEEGEIPFEGGAGRRVAMAVGTAVHRMLENFDLGGSDPDEEWKTRLEEGLEWLSFALPGPGSFEAARRRLETLAERFRAGPLWQKFLDLDGSIVARELALVARPDADGAVGAVSGSIDLVYREFSTGELVVADFKTDHRGGDDELRERAVVYGPQLEIYARALQSAMKLQSIPRKELWFLEAGRTVVLK